jgi:hypothetical protein
VNRRNEIQSSSGLEDSGVKALLLKMEMGGAAFWKQR